MNFEHLKTMDASQLREIAGKQGLHVHHKAKNETVIKQIMESALLPKSPTPEMQHMAAQPAKPVYNHTEEDIEALIAPIKARIPQFEAIYPNDGTWIFRCKGAEESGNMSIPPRVIKMKAENVSRGRLILMGLNEHFDKTTASGNNAYTNSVLSV